MSLGLDVNFVCVLLLVSILRKKCTSRPGAYDQPQLYHHHTCRSRSVKMTMTVFLNWEMSTPLRITTILNGDITEYSMAGRLESFPSSPMWHV